MGTTLPWSTHQVRNGIVQTNPCLRDPASHPSVLDGLTVLTTKMGPDPGLAHRVDCVLHAV